MHSRQEQPCKWIYVYSFLGVISSYNIYNTTERMKRGPLDSLPKDIEQDISL